MITKKNDFEKFFDDFTMILKQTIKNIYLLDNNDLIHDDDFCNKYKR